MVISLECTCGQRFNVPDHLAGKKGRCPACGEQLEIPSAPPTHEAPVEPTPAASDAAELMPIDSPRRRILPRDLCTSLRIVMLVGAALLIVSVAVPWRTTTPTTDDGAPLRAAVVFGLHTAGGITALCLGLIAAVVVAVPMCIDVLKRWAWIPESVSALMMIPVLVLATVWMCTAPEADVTGLYRQEPHVGPLLAIVGALAVAVGGTLNGIAGVKTLERNQPH